jgi:hypothetical protein
MNPADIRKLLGGYAAGILTEEERRALFEAALTDQDLFNELAREQALKEVLEDPGARRQLRAALEEKPAFVDRLRAWMGRPVAWVAAGSLAVAALLVVVVVRRAEAPLAPEPVMTAKLEAPALPATPQTSNDREGGAIAPTAIPAAPPVPARKAEPETPLEIAAGPARRADAVVQPPAAVEVQPGAVPAGVVGGIAGARPPAASNQVSVQAEAVPQYQITGPSMQALEAVRGEARQLNSLGRFAAADAVANKTLNAAVVPPPVAYRILRAGADGKFAEAPAGTAFRAADRVRVIFSPPSAGRLAATAANRPKPLLDRAVKQSAIVNLDLPAGVSSVQVTFTAQPERPGAAAMKAAAVPAPVTFSIAIPREPAP